MLGSIRTAYETYQKHDFSRGFQFRLISMDGVPEYVATELLDKPAGLGGMYYIQSASIPGRSLGAADLQYQGFTFRIPGAVEYDGEWTVTFRTAANYLGRNALERWHFETFSDETSCGRFKIPCRESSITVGLMDSDCKIVRTYRLEGVFPKSLSPIEYSVAEGTDVTSYTATFAYQWWRPEISNNSRLFDSGADPVIDSIYDNYFNQILQQKDNC